MSIIKYILLVFFIVLLILLETSLSLLGESVSFIFVAMVVFLIRDIRKATTQKTVWSTYALIIALSGGLLLDIYSPFSFGLFFISLVITFYISSRFILPRLSLINIINVMMAGIISSIVYSMVLLSTGYLYYFLRLSDIKIILDRIYLLDIFWFVILNSLLITLIYYLLKIQDLRKT